MLVAGDGGQLAAGRGQGDDACAAQATGVVLVAFALGGVDELNEAAAVVAPLRFLHGAAARVGDALALDAAPVVVGVARTVAAGILHGDQAVERIVCVHHGPAVGAALPYDAAEVVVQALRARGRLGGLRPARDFGADGVDEAVGVDCTQQASIGVVVPVAPTTGVVAHGDEAPVRVVAQGFGLLEARAAPAAFHHPSFGVVAEGVEYAEGAGVPAQLAVLVPGLEPVGGRREARA